MTDDELRSMLRTWQAPRAPRSLLARVFRRRWRRGDGSFRERSGYRCRLRWLRCVCSSWSHIGPCGPGPRVCPTFSRSSNFNPES